jgi:hypothetical protein
VVYLEGCVSRESQGSQLESLARETPDVQQALAVVLATDLPVTSPESGAREGEGEGTGTGTGARPNGKSPSSEALPRAWGRPPYLVLPAPQLRRASTGDSCAARRAGAQTATCPSSTSVSAPTGR